MLEDGTALIDEGMCDARKSWPNYLKQYNVEKIDRFFIIPRKIFTDRFIEKTH